MKRILCAGNRRWLTAVVFVPGFLAAQADTLDGTWHIDGDVSGTPVAVTCVLAEKDAKISGTCTGTDGKPVPVTGSIKEAAINWSYDTTYEGSSITLSYKAKQDTAGHMVGSIEVAPFSVSGDFTAKRDAPAAKP